MDETTFNFETKLFLVVHLNTKAILGYIQGQDCRKEDLVIELYKKILNQYEFREPPVFIHSDMEYTYNSKKIRQFLKKENIYVSNTEGVKNQNQMSEAVNGSIKLLVTQLLIENTNTKAYRSFLSTLPDNLRSMYKKNQRCQDKEYRKCLFESKLFKDQQQYIIKQAIIRYNKRDFSKGMTREVAQFYDSFIEGRTIENMRLVKLDDIIARVVQNDSLSSIKEVETKISKILSSDLKSENKIVQIVSIVAQRQDSSDKSIQTGFIGMAVKNEELQSKL